MIQITLTPDQLKVINEATETVAFVDDRGQILASVDTPTRKLADRVYSSIPELVDDLGEWDAEELKQRLARFEPACQGRAFEEVERIAEDPHRLQATTIAELIEELDEDDWEEEELTEILANYQQAGTLGEFLQRVTKPVDAKD